MSYDITGCFWPDDVTDGCDECTGTGVVRFCPSEPDKCGGCETVPCPNDCAGCEEQR